MNFINDLTVWRALIIVVTIIAVDTIFGILVAITQKQFRVEVKKLPQFLVTGVLPYLGALTLLAALNEYVPEWTVIFTGVFYSSAVFVLTKYITTIGEKIKILFS